MALMAMPAAQTVVSFTESGTLGLKLVENTTSGACHLVGLNPGTQAERHGGVLRPGRMMVSAVAGRCVLGMSYSATLGLIKAGGRPLELTFVEAQPLQSPAKKPRRPAPVPTGKAAAVALQEHIATSGTKDVKTIDRLRRASLQPDTPGRSADKAAAAHSAAAMMAAAMAVVDEVDEYDNEEVGSEVKATFREQAPLGIKFSLNKPTGEVEILSLNAGGQAERAHPQLHAGLILIAIAGQSARGQGYRQILGLLKGGGRPLSLRFKDGGMMHTTTRLAPPQSPAAATVLAQQEDDEAEVRTAAATPRTPPCGGGGSSDPAALEAAVEERVQKERARAATEMERVVVQHEREMSDLQRTLAVEKQLKLTLQEELSAQGTLISELNANLALGPSPRKGGDVEAVQRQLDAEERRAASLTVQLRAEKSRAASESEQLQQQLALLQSRLEAAEAASGRDSAHDSEKLARAQAAAEDPRVAKERLGSQLAEEVETLRAELTAATSKHASELRVGAAELDLLKTQLAEQVKITELERRASAERSPVMAPSPAAPAAVEQFCVKCASAKSESVRNSLNDRQDELMRQRTELLARMEKTRSADRLKAMDAQLMAECERRMTVAAELTHVKEKAASAQELLLGAENEIARLKADLQKSEQELFAQRAQVTRLVKDSAESQEAAVNGAMAASAAKYAVELSGEQQQLHASLLEAKELAEQELATQQARAAQEMRAARDVAAAAAEDHALGVTAIKGDLEAARSEAVRLRVELQEARQAHADLATSHEASMEHALMTAGGKHAVDVTSIRNEMEVVVQASRSEMATKMDDLRGKGVNEVESLRSDLTSEMHTQATEYAQELTALKEELRMAKEIVETETQMRLEVESEKESVSQLALIDRDTLGHEAAMSIELAQAATEAVADAQRTAEAMQEHHQIEILALRTTSTTEIGELSRNHHAEMRFLKTELDQTKTEAEKEMVETMTSTSRELQQMQARHGADQYEAAEESSKRLEVAQAVHLAAVDSARQQAEVAAEQHKVEVRTLRAVTETVRQEVLRLREECQSVRDTSSRELAELAASHKAELQHAEETAEARHTLEMSALTNSMKATMHQSKSKMTTEMEALVDKSNTDLESLRSALTLELRTNANEYARKLAALSEELTAAKDVIEKDTKRKQDLEIVVEQLKRTAAASVVETHQLKEGVSSLTEETANALAEAHSTATEMANSHQLELVALRAQQSSEIEQMTKVHGLEKQSLQSDLTSTKMRCEEELHNTTMQHARDLEEMQSRHNSAEAQTAEDTAVATEQIKLTCLASISAAKAVSDAEKVQQDATLETMQEDCEAQRLEKVRLQTELQDVRAEQAAELEDMADSNAAAAAGIAAAAAGRHAADMSVHEEMTEETIQQAHEDAQANIETARKEAEVEMASLRAELTNQVRATATGHAEQLEAAEQHMRDAQAEAEVAVEKRVELEVELERLQAAAAMEKNQVEEAHAHTQAAATIQAKYRTSQNKRNVRGVSSAHAKRMAEIEVSLSDQAAQVVAEAKQMNATLQDAHSAELAELKSMTTGELHETTAQHAARLEALQLELETHQAEAAATLTAAQEAHGQELESVHESHGSAKKKSEDQKAAWLAEVQAAMKRSVAAMESASATTAAEHEAKINQMEAAVRRAEAESNHFRTVHAEEVEERISLVTMRQDALDEHEVMGAATKQAEVRAARALAQVQEKNDAIVTLEEESAADRKAFEVDRAGLEQAHRKKLAKMELARVETVQESADRLAKVQASHRRSIEVLEAAAVAAADGHAQAIQALQAEALAQRRSAEVARLTDTVALGAAACTLEIKWRGRQTAFEGTGKAKLVEMAADSEGRVLAMQRENEVQLEMMVQTLRSETVAKVKGLESSHREELEAMQHTWRAEASLNSLQQSLSDAQNRASKLSERKQQQQQQEQQEQHHLQTPTTKPVAVRKKASSRSPPRGRQAPRGVAQQAHDGAYTPRMTDAALIGRADQAPQGHNGRMEVKRALPNGPKRATATRGTPRASPRASGQSEVVPTPRQVQAELLAVQRLQASGATAVVTASPAANGGSVRPKAKAQAVRRKAKVSTTFTTDRFGGESLSIRSNKSPGVKKARVNASAPTNGSGKKSPRSPRQRGGSPGRAAPKPSSPSPSPRDEADGEEAEEQEYYEDEDYEDGEEEEEEEYIEEYDEDEERALAELRKRVANAEAQIVEARQSDMNASGGADDSYADLDAAGGMLADDGDSPRGGGGGGGGGGGFSTLQQSLMEAEEAMAGLSAGLMDSIASPISPTADSAELNDEEGEEEDDEKMAIAWARVRRGEASGYVQATSDTPRLLEKARRATSGGSGGGQQRDI